MLAFDSVIEGYQFWKLRVLLIVRCFCYPSHRGGSLLPVRLQISYDLNKRDTRTDALVVDHGKISQEIRAR